MNTKLKGALVAGALTIAALSAAQGIKVTVNDDPVYFSGTQPMTIGSRVFVPLRGVFEEMGAYVEWQPATQAVIATQGNNRVRLSIGNSLATVNGSSVSMDEPARLVNGRTMVPLRFISESLGAQVNWYVPSRTVAITTAAEIANERTNPPPVGTTEMVIENGTVIPVVLDRELSSNDSREGDKFTASIRSSGPYAGLPNGTKIEGTVVTAKAKEGRNPGMLELDFTRVIMPDGRAMAIDGSLIALDNNSVTRREDGTYVAKSSSRDDRLVYAGYGAGAGLIVGLLTKRPLEGAVLGGVLGYLYGELQRSNQQAADVRLKTGTEFGVRLDRDLVWRG